MLRGKPGESLDSTYVLIGMILIFGGLSGVVLLLTALFLG